MEYTYQYDFPDPVWFIEKERNKMWSCLFNKMWLFEIKCGHVFLSFMQGLIMLIIELHCYEYMYITKLDQG